MKEKTIKKCVYCGGEFLSKRIDARFCSTRCCGKATRAERNGLTYEEYKQKLLEDRQMAAERAKEASRPKYCLYCGKEFKPAAGHQKYCGISCSRRGNRARILGISIEEYKARHEDDGKRYVHKYIPTPKKTSHLDQMIAEADAKGMSYGQYKAWLRSQV